MERTTSVALAAATPVRAHFCDYATGVRLLAANHKNDTDSCAIPRAPLRSIAHGQKERARDREGERAREIGGREMQEWEDLRFEDKRRMAEIKAQDEQGHRKKDV